MSCPVTLINATTFGTGATGVTGVYQDQRHTHQLRLVLQLLAQVVKCPRVVLSPLALSNRNSLSNARQIFEGNAERVPLSLFNNSLGDYVVNGLRHALLFVVALLEQAASRLRAFALQFPTQAGMAMTQSVKVIARIILAIAGSGDIDDSQIHTQKLLHVLRVRGINLASGEQVKLAVNQTQVGLATLRLEQFELALASPEGNSLAALRRPNADFLLSDVPAQDAVIVGNRAVWLEGARRLAVKLIGVGDLRDATHHDLGRQSKLRLDSVVHQLVNAKLMELALLPGYVADVVASGIGLLKCFEQTLMLFWCRLQLDPGREFHAHIIAHYHLFDKKEGTAQFLPRLKTGVSLRQIL